MNDFAKTLAKTLNATYNDVAKLDWDDQVKAIEEDLEKHPDKITLVYDKATGNIVVFKPKTEWEKEVDRRKAEAAAKREAELAQMRMARKARLAKQKAKEMARMNKKN